MNIGNNLGTHTLRILDPGGPVVINNTSNLTLSIANGGGIDLSNATQDLTLNNAFTRIGVGGSSYTVNTGPGRTVTFNGWIHLRRGGHRRPCRLDADQPFHAVRFGCRRGHRRAS